VLENTYDTDTDSSVDLAKWARVAISSRFNKISNNSSLSLSLSLSLSFSLDESFSSKRAGIGLKWVHWEFLNHVRPIPERQTRARQLREKLLPSTILPVLHPRLLLTTAKVTICTRPQLRPRGNNVNKRRWRWEASGHLAFNLHFLIPRDSWSYIAFLFICPVRSSIMVIENTLTVSHWVMCE